MNIHVYIAIFSLLQALQLERGIYYPKVCIHHDNDDHDNDYNDDHDNDYNDNDYNDYDDHNNDYNDDHDNDYDNDDDDIHIFFHYYKPYNWRGGFIILRYIW
jgi:hypothetical protein